MNETKISEVRDMQKRRPIGVFDSGVGGLTAMRELIRLLPGEDVVYFGDTARVPYGPRNRETILEFAVQDLKFLLSQNVRAVLVACGTVSSVALDKLRKMTDIPIIGVIEPAALKALQISTKKRIAVLATQATIASRAYPQALLRLSKTPEKLEIFEEACPLFVPVVENGYVEKDHPIVKAVIEEYIKPVREFGADTVILGCTHYPLLSEAIRSYDPELTLVESGKEAVSALAELLPNIDLHADGGERTYYVSENTDSFRFVCELFVGEDISGKIRTASPEYFT